MTAPVTTWRYYLPSENGEGWAIVFMDSIGTFSTVSDWGNYGYRWDEAGWGPHGLDFRAFVVGRGDDYLLSKLAPEPQYDAHETLLAVKREILRIRRGYEMTRDEARDEWEKLADHDDLGSREEFHRWLFATDLGTIEAHELARFRPHAQAEQFIKRVIPRLREAVRADLLREAEAADGMVDDLIDAWHAVGGIRNGRPVTLAEWLRMSVEKYAVFLTDPARHARISKADRGDTGTGAAGTVDDPSEEKRGALRASKASQGDSSASPGRAGVEGDSSC